VNIFIQLENMPSSNPQDPTATTALLLAIFSKSCIPVMVKLLSLEGLQDRYSDVRPGFRASCFNIFIYVLDL